MQAIKLPTFTHRTQFLRILFTQFIATLAPWGNESEGNESEVRRGLVRSPEGISPKGGSPKSGGDKSGGR
jgi:hypothetical protein